jgi:hypothetical protein
LIGLDAPNPRSNDPRNACVYGKSVDHCFRRPPSPFML